MAIAKVILNGVTQMDVTQKTVDANKMLSGTTALKNDGTDITGNIASQAAQTIHPSTTDQTISPGRLLTGTQTFKAVTTTNLTAANIVSGVTVKIGDSTDDDCVASVTGTASGGGGNDFIITLTYDPNGLIPDCTYAEAVAAYNGGKNVVYTSADGPTFGEYSAEEECIYLILDMQYAANDWSALGQCVSMWTSTGVEVIVDPESESPPAFAYFTSNATAVPADVASGKVFYNADGYQVGTASGGGGEPIEPVDRSDVNFIDYDGTILYSYTAAEAAELTALPANPSHSGLTAQGWNYTLAQMKAEVTALGKCDIGQMYVTSDGKTRIYCTFQEGRLSPYLGICPNGTVVVDWGDGSSTDTLTGTSLTTRQMVQHTYASAGNYVITLTVSSGSFAFYGASAGAYLLTKNESTGNESRTYLNTVTRIELGANASIGKYAFFNCCSLMTITIPSGVTSIMESAFRYCCSLVSVTVPSGVTEIGNYGFQTCNALSVISIPSSLTTIGYNNFQDCYALQSIVFPSASGITSLASTTFQNCHALTSITIPSSVTAIGNSLFRYCYALASFNIPSSTTQIVGYSFQYCYALASITIPSSVTSIGGYAFHSCYGMREYHFEPTTPPTLADTNAFTNIPSDCKIYVPYSSDHSILEAYQTATNWSTYADYMVEESA